MIISFCLFLYIPKPTYLPLSTVLCGDWLLGGRDIVQLQCLCAVGGLLDAVGLCVLMLTVAELRNICHHTTPHLHTFI